MKIKLTILAVAVIWPVAVYADNCVKHPDSVCSSAGSSGSLDFCSARHKSECWYVEGVTTRTVYSCTGCAGNRTLQKNKQGMCDIDKVYATECVCSNGCRDVAWTAGNTGYEYGVTCGSTCDAARKYRCAKGYWGSSTNGTSGCNRCPSSGGVYGTTAAAGSTSITSCYIPSGSSFSETAGRGTYTGNCYYKN